MYLFYNLKGWKKLVYDTIKEKFGFSVFTLDQLYEFEEQFSKSYPENSHIQSHIRDTLQKLRDIGLVDFIDYYGTYKLRV